MRVITIQKSVCIVSILYLLVNVVHSAEPSTSVTLPGATEQQPTTIDITKRITSATDSTTGIDSTSDTNGTNLGNSSGLTAEEIVTPDAGSSAQITTPVTESTTTPPAKTTNPQPTTTPEPTTTTPDPTTSSDVNTSSEQPTSSTPEVTPSSSSSSSSSAPVESTTSSSSETPPSSSSAVVPSSTTPPPVASSASSSSHRTTSATSSTSNSRVPSSTSSHAPTASATSQPQQSSSNKTGTIVGAVVGSVVGAALIVGLLTWLNRKGGCTKRRKDEIDQNDYTINMNQTDFASTAGATGAAAGAGKATANEPISPFDHSRRFVPPTTAGINNYNGNELNYDGYNNGYPQHQQGDYGYYDAAGAGAAAATVYPQQQPYDQYGYENNAAYDQHYDSNRHEMNYNNDNYSYYTGPSASRTSGSDWNQGSAGYQDKPNLRDQKPNQV